VGELCVTGRILEWNLNRISCGMDSVGLTVVMNLLVSYVVSHSTFISDVCYFAWCIVMTKKCQ